MLNSQVLPVLRAEFTGSSATSMHVLACMYLPAEEATSMHAYTSEGPLLACMHILCKRPAEEPAAPLEREKERETEREREGERERERHVYVQKTKEDLQRHLSC